MKDEKRDAFIAFGEMGSLGFTLVLCTFVGLGAGYMLDRVFHTSPLFTITLLLFGIAAGFVYIIFKFGNNGKNK